MKAKKPKHPLVMVIWEDSCQPLPAWHYLDGLEVKEPVVCKSVGWLIHDGKRVKALAPNIGDAGGESEQSCGIIRIATSSIVKIVRLKEPTSSLGSL